MKSRALFPILALLAGVLSSCNTMAPQPQTYGVAQPSSNRVGTSGTRGGEFSPQQRLPAIPSYSRSTYSDYDTTVRKRSNGWNIYNWRTGDDIDVKHRYDNKYSGYNWRTGDDYDIKMKERGRADVYNWKTGEDIELKRNSDGSIDSYNWTTGEWKTIDPYWNL